MAQHEPRSITRLHKRPSIRDTVTRALRSAIISGEMQPEQVYSAPALGATFGVSATPIREAMLDLEREGLVVPVRNRGFRVTEVSRHDLEEVTELRMMLEPPAVAKATPVVPDDAFPGLRAQAEAIVEAAARGDLVDYLSADGDFHAALLSYAGNAELVRLVADLRSRTRLFGLAALAEQGRLTASAQEHHTILDAVQKRDAALAADLVHRHIGHVLTDWGESAT